jgi:hypothetical protein
MIYSRFGLAQKTRLIELAWVHPSYAMSNNT